jgi:biopolymer transport protein ExbB
MIRWTRPLIAACLVQATLALGAHAVVESLDELLEQTKNARAIEAKQNAARVEEFLASRDRQAQMLADAKARRDAAQKRSEQLSAAFDANELKLNDLETLLKSREGNLGELFGVTRQLTGDLSSVVYNSLTSAQFPGRDLFFSKLAKGKALPSIKELEQLWFEMLREMTETGTVARFKANVVTADGKQEPADVVRIGPFIAMSDGKYLNYAPHEGLLQVLARQPGPEMIEAAENLQGATSGYTSSFVDPSRGVLLAIAVQRPDIWERIEHGEAVGYVILLVGVLGSIVAVYQFFYLVFVRMAVSRQLKDLDHPKSDNPLGRVLASFKGDPGRIEEDSEVVELRISEAVLKEVPSLERFQAFLRLAVAAGPLLGLIGTVIGMIITFQSITESGSSDPKLMANGISQAMIATVLGLGIAIPLLFANAGLVSLSGGIVQVLDEQSTGLLAERIERRTAEDQRAEPHRRV